MGRRTTNGDSNFTTTRCTPHIKKVAPLKSTPYRQRKTTSIPSGPACDGVVVETKKSNTPAATMPTVLITRANISITIPLHTIK